MVAHRFGRAKDQVTRRLQGVVKGREEPLLQRRFQVDQHVAAADEVEVRERRVGRHVLPGEDAHVPDALLHPEAAARPLEEAPQPLRRDFGLDGVRIEPGACPVERRLVREVGGEDLDRRPDGDVSKYSVSVIATEYASWPDEQPGTQTRIGSAGGRSP